MRMDRRNLLMTLAAGVVGAGISGCRNESPKSAASFKPVYSGQGKIATFAEQWWLLSNHHCNLIRSTYWIDLGLTCHADMATTLISCQSFLADQTIQMVFDIGFTFQYHLRSR
jgi:hypothetical protein